MATSNPFTTRDFFRIVVVVLILIGAAGIVYSIDKGYNLSKEVWKGKTDQIIYATGITKVKAMPDIAYVSYTLRFENEDLKLASTNLAESLDETISKLVSSGIPREDIYLSQYQINRAMASRGEMEQMPSSVSQGLTVELRGGKDELNAKLLHLDQVALAGDLMPANNGASYICLDFSDKVSTFSAARRLAVEDAYRQAFDLADAAGLTLGRAVNISDSMYGFGGVNSPYGGYCSTSLGSGRMIEEQEVPVSVSVNYEVR